MGEIKGGLIFIKKYSLEARVENKLVSSIYVNYFPATLLPVEGEVL